MSSDDSTSDDVYRAPPLGETYQPRLNTLGVTANAHTLDGAPSTRGDIYDGLHGGGRPNLWDAVNYPGDGALDTFATHWARYERQGFARGLIDKPANDTWQDLPDIVDHDSGDDSDTEFEEAVQRLWDGEPLRRSPLHRFNVADRLARLGQYSLLVLGTADTDDLSQPIRGADVDPTDDDPWGEEDGELDGLSDLAYIATFGEDRVVEIDTVTDMADPRFRLPETYELVTDEDADGEDDGTETVHWTRVIHVPQDTLEDDLRGTRYLKPLFHNLVNLDKILAGSAEGYWRGGYQGLVVRPPTGPDGQMLQFSDEDDGGGQLSENIDAYQRNMKRLIATTGEVESLGTQVSDPQPHMEAQVREMMAARDIPQSVFMGNETGERATTEDSTMWKEHISGERNNYAEPVIVRPLIDRLIAIGVLPRPSGDGYDVEWPPLDELSAQEQADVAETIANALSTLTGKAPDRIATRAELRDVVGWDPTLGAEVDGATIQPDDELDDPEADDLRVDDEDDEVQDVFAEQQGDDSTLPDDEAPPPTEGEGDDEELEA